MTISPETLSTFVLCGARAEPAGIQIEPGLRDVVGLAAMRAAELKWRLGSLLDGHRVMVSAPDGAMTSSLDLPIALALKGRAADAPRAFGEVYPAAEGWRVRPVRGAYILAKSIRAAGLEPLCSIANAMEVGCLGVEWLTNPATRYAPREVKVEELPPIPDDMLPGLTAVQSAVDQGARSVLIESSPGAGATMIARRVRRDALDPKTLDETQVNWSAAGLGPVGLRRPFRAPHHTVSEAGVVGRVGRQFVVGEAALAHGGVLFLPEVCEMRRPTFDAVRTAHRSRVSASGLPADFVLIGSVDISFADTEHGSRLRAMFDATVRI